ncbi:hypothetical protein ES708_22369 [subsurface metagenome]
MSDGPRDDTFSGKTMRRVAEDPKASGHPLYKQRDSADHISQIRIWGGSVSGKEGKINHPPTYKTSYRYIKPPDLGGPVSGKEGT